MYELDKQLRIYFVLENLDKKCTCASILMLVQCTHPSGSCTWRIKISACVHYFV